jgi:DivIVA domain-containing protein
VILFLVLIVLVLVGLTTAAVLGKIGGFLADATTSQSFNGVPPGPISTQDIEQLHFDQGLRGYRMDQVDEVLDALCVRLNDLESEIASLSVPGGSEPAAWGVSEASTEPESAPEPKGELTPEPQGESAPEPQSEPAPEPKSAPAPEPKGELTPEPKGEPTSERQE